MSGIVHIPLNTGHTVIVNAVDAPLVSGKRWTRNTNSCGTSYAMRRNGKRTEMMHRLIMGEPAGMDVDHRDGDGLNNTRENLRVVTRKQNLLNVARAKKNSRTGVLNVIPYKETRFQVRLHIDGHSRHFGVFDTLDEAAIAAYEARLKHYGPDAVARIPDPRRRRPLRPRLAQPQGVGSR